MFHLFFETTFNSNVSNTLNKYLDALVGSYSVYSLNIFCFVIYYIILYNIFCFVIKRSFNENKNYSLLCLSAVSCDPVALGAGFQGCVGSMPVGCGSRSVVGWVMWPPVVCAGSRDNWGWFGRGYHSMRFRHFPDIS